MSEPLPGTAFETRIAGFGQVVTGAPADFAHNASSLFADPLAWLVSEAVDRAVGDSGLDLTSVRDDVGIIVVSDECTLSTLHHIATSAPRGRFSPLKFAGASPGSLAGLPCIRHGFRGPSLVLSMRPADGIAAAASVAAQWLERGHAHTVLVCTTDRSRDHAARCVVLVAAETPDAQRVELATLLAPSPEGTST